MKTRTILICENCGKDILKPDSGVILRGSIFPAEDGADPILGKASKDSQPDSSSPTPTEGGEGSDSPNSGKRDRGGRPASMAYCLRCFTEALGLTPNSVAKLWQELGLAPNSVAKLWQDNPPKPGQTLR